MNAFRLLRSIRAPGVACAFGVLTGVAVENYRNKWWKVDAAVSIIGPQGSQDLIRSDYTPNTEKIMQHGFPTTDNIRSFQSFVLSYDRRTRNALWVYEHLTPDSLQHTKNVDRSNCEFFEDTSIHPFFRSLNADYFKSGYDRGHLAPAGNNRSSKELVAQTFVLSNISPQVGKGFNRDAWNRLEQYVRYRGRKSVNTWVCTGPLFLPFPENGKKYVRYEVIGKNHVAVPTHFFKVLLVESEPNVYELECYVMQNKPLDDNVPLQAYQVPLDSIERAAGFLIFEKVPRNVFKQINGMNPHLKKFTNLPPPKYLPKQ
ncbi:Endonuclease G-like protein [Leptotrombidium deliense]|uniref:Endonuclease n=1 Tax=Leptotrombidium deliense TaxID=299467 RepID=A0A443S034_9ACAR|nr:Endonuclease G-like protein [Leptotrombidium deliense]